MRHDDSVRISDQRVIEATLDRLEAGLGREAIHELLVGFAANLADAVTAMDRAEARSVAHRIAGSAGTLGFASLGKYWLELANGNDSIVEKARASALEAQELIAWRTRSPASSTTSV